jgi:hypothetical protein
VRHAAAPDVAPGEQLGGRGALDALQITWLSMVKTYDKLMVYHKIIVYSLWYLYIYMWIWYLYNYIVIYIWDGKSMGYVTMDIYHTAQGIIFR